MAFTLSTFVKLSGTVALREHLQARGIALAERIDLDSDDAALARLFRKAWSKLSEGEIRELSQDFDRADAFAGEDAQAVLRTSCLPHREAIAELDRWSSDRARALAILRSAPAVFENAETRLDVGKLLANRQLSAGYQLHGTFTSHWSDATEAAFLDLARVELRKKDGLPRRVTVRRDVRQRRGPDGETWQPLHQLTLFHEADLNREPVFASDGEVRIEERRRALMAAVTFDPELGTLDVAVRGGRRVQRALANAFTTTFCPGAPMPTKNAPARFALMRLKRPMPFSFRRSDGLRSVALVRLHLAAQGEGRANHKPELPSRVRNATLWQLLDRQFPRDNPLNDPAMMVVAAELRFEFEPGLGEKRPKKRTVKLSLDNGSNKSKLTEGQQRIVETYLREWQLLDAHRADG